MTDLPKLDPAAEALWRIIAELSDQGRRPSILELSVKIQCGIGQSHYLLGMLVGRGLVMRRNGHREIILLVHPSGKERPAKREPPTVLTLLPPRAWRERIRTLPKTSLALWTYLESHPAPTLTEIATELGVVITTVVTHLNGLEFLGIVVLTDRQSRGIRLVLDRDEVDAATVKMIP